MIEFFSGVSVEWYVLLVAVAVTLFAGVVKGAIGFALPLLFLTGLSLVLPIQTVVALIAIPALVTNLLQAQYSGLSVALRTLREFWILCATLFVVTLLSTRLVGVLPAQTLILVLGVGALALTLLQIVGRPRRIPRRVRPYVELAYGGAGGFFGGLAGLWGATILTYFLALRLDKEKFVTVTGVAWLAGSVPYVAGHAQQGVLTAPLAAWSAAALIPTLGGMWIGRRVQNRVNQVLFRRAVLFVMVISTLNLIRRGIWG